MRNAHLCQHGLSSAWGTIQENPLHLPDQVAPVQVRVLQRLDHPVDLRTQSCHFDHCHIMSVVVQPQRVEKHLNTPRFATDRAGESTSAHSSAHLHLQVANARHLTRSFFTLSLPPIWSREQSMCSGFMTSIATYYRGGTTH